MIEPAALAKPVIVGTHTSNFADAMLKFRSASAMIEVASGDALQWAMEALLHKTREDNSGREGERVVQEQQGSTLRHAAIILRML